MHPTVSNELAEARVTDRRDQAQREARARVACWTRHRPVRLTEDDAQRQALFASSLQRSDTPGADVVAEAISANLRQLGTHGCVARMAQEFGDHPEAAAERMRWVRSLLSSPKTRVPVAH